MKASTWSQWLMAMVGIAAATGSAGAAPPQQPGGDPGIDRRPTPVYATQQIYLDILPVAVIYVPPGESGQQSLTRAKRFGTSTTVSTIRTKRQTTGNAGGQGPATSVPATPTPPALTYCRPEFLMTHPSPFAPGQVVKRFHVQLERGCHTREAPLTLEVWYRAVGHDRQGQPVRQAPRLVGAVNTWTNKLEGHDSDGAHLKHYHVPAPAPLHAGCYILKVKIAGETTGPSASSKDHRAVQAGPERVGQLEVCTEVLQLRLGSHASRDHRQ